MALHLVPGLGPRRFHRLIAEFGSAEQALSASPGALEGVLGPAVASRLCDPAARKARRAAALAALERLAGTVLVYGDPDYPSGLLDLPDPPPVLWVRGRLPPGFGRAIVGTRRASGTACQWAEAAAFGLAQRGIPVISGGAYGVDAAAHRGALRAEGATVVVLGGGLDRPYPDRHIPLFEMAADRGAVLSPFPPGTAPTRGGFLARNALIAALSEAVVVVEAGWRSGARSTALHARALGRAVLAVSGSPGADRLLAEGAVSVAAPDALWTWQADGRGAVDETRAAPADPLEAALCRLGPCRPADLAAHLGVTVSEVLVAATRLRLAGAVVALPGGQLQWLGQTHPGRTKEV